MKIRTKLVSNSSSSSFICDVCGDTITGWDSEYDEDVWTCVNGHNLCDEDILDSTSEDPEFLAIY